MRACLCFFVRHLFSAFVSSWARVAGFGSLLCDAFVFASASVCCSAPLVVAVGGVPVAGIGNDPGWHEREPSQVPDEAPSELTHGELVVQTLASYRS